MPRTRSDSQDDAYTPLEATDVLPVLSLLCFAASVAARHLSHFLPRALRVYPRGVVAPVFLSLAFALVGLVLALLGRRRPGRRGIAGIGALLNGIVLLLSGLAALGIFWIVRH